MPKISVIMPSYNHGEYIGKSIESVLGQSYVDFEFLIADDMSNDNSQDIIKGYSDPRIKTFFFMKNRGASETTNYLIENAKGDYIALINSDDCWHFSKLEKQINFLEGHLSYAACFTRVSFINEEGKCSSTKNKFAVKNKTQEEWILKFFEDGNCLCHPSMMIRKSVYSEVGKYSLIYKQLPDFDMWIRIIKKYNIYVIEEELTLYRWLMKHTKNTSYPTVDNITQYYFESVKIMSGFFHEMNEKMFNDVFKGHFNSNVNNIAEMKCEQYFLLLNGKSYLKQRGIAAAINYFIEIYDNENVRRMFSEKYNYDIDKFHKVISNLNTINMTKNCLMKKYEYCKWQIKNYAKYFLNL